MYAICIILLVMFVSFQVCLIYCIMNSATVPFHGSTGLSNKLFKCFFFLWINLSGVLLTKEKHVNQVTTDCLPPRIRRLTYEPSGMTR